MSCEQESSRLDRLSLIYLLHCPGCINDPVTALSWTDLSDQEDLESSVEAHLDAPIISHGIRQDLRPLSQRVALPVESIKPVSLDGLRPHSVKVRLSSWSDTTGQDGLTPVRVWQSVFDDTANFSLKEVPVDPATGTVRRSAGSFRLGTQNANPSLRDAKHKFCPGQTIIPDSVVVPQSECAVFEDSSNLTLIGLNHEAEALWQYRLTRFLCCPGDFSTNPTVPDYNTVPGNVSTGQDGLKAADETPGAREALQQCQNIRPFFSYVRTTEGSSLLTDIEVLRKMFPDDEERSLLIYNEKDISDVEIDFGSDDIPSGVGWRRETHGAASQITVTDIQAQHHSSTGVKRCIRIDLGTLTDGQDTVHLGEPQNAIVLSARLACNRRIALNMW